MQRTGPLVLVFLVIVASSLSCRTSGPSPGDGAAAAATAESTRSVDAAPTAPPSPTRPACTAQPPDWPTFQGTGDRRGRMDVDGLRRPQVRWRQSVGVQSWLNNPVIADDVVFVGSSGMIWNRPDGQDGVYAIGLDDGELRWFAQAADDVNGIAWTDCLVVATGDEGAVWALDARTGERVWEKRFDDRKVYTSPLVVSGRVIVGDGNGYLRALDVRTGEEVWGKAFDAAIRGGASSDGERVYVTTEGARVAAFDARDGALVWSKRLDQAREIYAAPTVTGGLVVVGYARDTTYSNPAVVALDDDDGSTVWQASNPDEFKGGWGNVRSSPALWREQLIYAEPYSNRVVSLSTKDGRVLWSSAQGACFFPHWPSPAATADLVFVPRHDGGLYALDPTNGDAVWSMYLGDAAAGHAFPRGLRSANWTRCEWEPSTGKSIFSSPAIARDGTVIVGTGEGYLYALAPSGAAPGQPDETEPGSETPRDAPNDTDDARGLLPDVSE